MATLAVARPDPLSMGLNHTQISQVELLLLSDYAIHFIPAFIIESLAFGALSIAAAFGTYSTLRNGHPVRAGRNILVASAYAILVIHWVLAYRALAAVNPWPSSGMSHELWNYEVYLRLFTFETVLFGISTAVFLYASISFLSSNRHSQISSSLFPLVAVLVMYAAAFSHWALGVTGWIYSCTSRHRSRCYWEGYEEGTTSVVLSALLVIIVVCSDSIVLWRACVVWEKKRYIVRSSACFLVTVTACYIANLAAPTGYYSRGEKGPNGEAMDAVAPFNSFVGYAALISSILANIFGVLLIGSRAWVHRKLVRRHLSTSSRKLLTERILVLFVESGVLYIVLWIFYAALYAPSAVSLTFRNTVFGDFAWIYQYCIVQLIAIYPTILVVLVSLEKNARDNTRDNATGPSQVQLPPALLTIATMTRSDTTDVLIIGFETASYDTECGDLDGLGFAESGDTAEPDVIKKGTMTDKAYI